MASRFLRDTNVCEVFQGFLELVFGMRVRVSGDEIDYNEPALIIMNHRTRLDWMYMWSALFQMNPWLITSNKISLKAQLQSLPGAGFGMSAAQFLFLHRNKERDAATFDEAIAYYKDMQLNYQLLLFPEGTDKSPWTTLKSTEFAKKNGLKELKHLLYPRVAGFFHLLTKMKEAKFVTYVYDITIAYPYNIVQSEVDLVLKGSCPHEVHFHVKKIPANEVPRNEVDCARWLNERWIQKETTLEEYYGEPKSYNRRFQVEKGQGVWKNTKESPRVAFVKRFCFWFWMLVVTIVYYHITFLLPLQIAAFYFALAFFVIKFIYGSLDRCVMRRWQSSFAES
ncbi:Lysocardiolipin acyltransferase 1 [Trichostrongylus colubriformis]|uniref:Lysocardiolipin acyltransferase 1 n=1 Tax=Trichostrongylus colubriformis TaxID=6319 RepID=A0AAN8IMR3_TRICO